MKNLNDLRKEYEHKIQTDFPEALNPLKAALAVAAITCFKGNTQPTTLIFSGPSGSGKTLVLSFISSISTPPFDQLKDYIYRLDKFTPKSFVTHAANVSQEKLQEIDLLPKIEDKVLITKELATLFRGKTDDLTATFSILISVLDGKGYMSASGSQGTRGYDRSINFCWLGATTPLTSGTFALMAQLGTRLFFYNTTRDEKTIDQLVYFASRPDHFQKERECSEAVGQFLLEFYTQHPKRSFDESTIEYPEPLLRRLCILVRALAKLRIPSTARDGHDQDETSLTTATESVERAIVILKNIALGSALVEGRDHVNDFDLAQVEHIALSSCPEPRRRLFKALLECGGRATTRDLVTHTKYSKPTCLHYMRELAALGVCRHVPGQSDEAHAIVIDQELHELIRQPQRPGRKRKRRRRGVKQLGGVYGTPAQPSGVKQIGCEVLIKKEISTPPIHLTAINTKGSTKHENR